MQETKLEIKLAFEQEMAKPESQLNLAKAALLISQYLYKPIRASVYLDVIAAMARIIRPRIEAAGTKEEIIAILGQYLFEELKFSGNTHDYYHPHNSLLNKVIDLRMGIPISLSLLYLELGWQLGLPLYGINMPAHFIVGYGSPDNLTYIDVFNRGKIISEDECLVLAQALASEREAFRREFLKPTSKRAILFRLLLNLKQIYLSLEHWDQAYKTVDLMLIIRPKTTGELRDRALLAYRLKHFHEAIFDIQQYLLLVPEAQDADWLQKQLDKMEIEFLRLN